MIPSDGADLPALRFAPDEPNGAGIVVVQEIFGVGDYVQSRCQDLADQGYLVYAPVLYSRLDEIPDFDPEAEDYVMQGVTAASALDWDTTVADVAATLAALRADETVTGKVALHGFCFGGGVAFAAAAAAAPDALVAYYGSALPQLTGLAPQVRCPQLHHFGTADEYIDSGAQAVVLDALADGVGPVRWETYAGAGHAFDNPDGRFHHPQAASEAWQTTLEFLQHYVLA